MTGCMARWAVMLSEFGFTIVSRPGRVHLNADGLGRCLPPDSPTNPLVAAVEDDEQKVFQLKAQGVAASGNDLATTVAHLSVEYPAGEYNRNIMEALENDMTNDDELRDGRLSWTPPIVQLFQCDNDGADRVCVVAGDVEWILKVADGPNARGHFGVRATLSRVRELF